ncbi:hypothetical protein ACIRPH_30890 [Nocardiopsis sp. NPDC101807]|uniref:hypothetical protein n=1 Tax=Nocardiopsis sp. NPDC101807 TaxID=3364339 RepID=UPI0038220B12
MTPVRATRAATSPVVGHYDTVTVTDTDWDTGQPTGIRTIYRAYLANGTPAGTPISWGNGFAPATNTYPTEAKARAGIRRAHRHLAEIAAELDAIHAQSATHARLIGA